MDDLQVCAWPHDNVLQLFLYNKYIYKNLSKWDSSFIKERNLFSGMSENFLRLIGASSKFKPRVWLVLRLFRIWILNLQYTAKSKGVILLSSGKFNLVDVVVLICMCWLLMTRSETISTNWRDSPKSMLPIYKELIAAGLRIWVFRYIVFVFITCIGASLLARQFDLVQSSSSTPFCMPKQPVITNMSAHEFNFCKLKTCCNFGTIFKIWEKPMPSTIPITTEISLIWLALVHDVIRVLLTIERSLGRPCLS